MDLLEIGIVVIGWIALLTLAVACAAAAGRADRREARFRRLRATQAPTTDFPGPELVLRIRARRARKHTARAVSDRRVRTVIH